MRYQAFFLQKAIFPVCDHWRCEAVVAILLP